MASNAQATTSRSLLQSNQKYTIFARATELHITENGRFSLLTKKEDLAANAKVTDESGVKDIFEKIS